MTGLADGRILWDTLSERQHLFGEYRQNANYQAFYTWLNCLEISPCIGWVSD
jgi:acyloxyacyl hydrolase